MSLTCSIETAAVCPLTGHRAVAWYQMLKRAALQFTIRQLHHFFSSASALDLIAFSSSTSSSFQYGYGSKLWSIYKMEGDFLAKLFSFYLK